MLKSLYVKNYAIIDEISIEFDRGFNVFTGETGAGKSIIVGALSYLTKGKADTSIIKTGCDKTIIEGVFTVDDFMKEKLDEADIDYDDEIIVRRTISRDNHNSIKINQCSVTLGFLVDLFDEHIDIHSQKDSQYLLNKKNHLVLLDKYVNEPGLLNTYHDQYREYRDCLDQYNDLKNNTYNEADLDYYRFDLKELEDADLSLDEENDLIQKENRYKSSEKYLTMLNSCISLYEGDNGAKENLNQIIKELNIEDNTIEDIRNNLEDLYYRINDETDRLKDILASFDEDDLNIEYIEERLYTYSRLKRKHNTDVQGLIKKKEELQEKIRFFEDKDMILDEKKRKVDELYHIASETASRIHEARVSKSSELERKIVEQCDDLMLNNVEFKVNIQKTDLGTNGIDDVEFFISLNKNQELRPLKNIASGGEISRLMLALKTVFTGLSDTALVVFDEIDTGISGKTGLSVGIKIADIARLTQVIAITHLASVAACASSHFYIYKNDDENGTRTAIKLLDHDEIINELAYISSTDNSQVALEAARELYESAQESVRK